ncbi:GNAT family N-acetyltransferase [Trueperella sp.]|uniref:GNAT family N-acetyltransferase n=1 Tax=Trueperella sp. TaxID=2699835 RepID=UPI003736A91E
MHTGKLTGRTLEQRLAAPSELPLPSAHLGLTWRSLCNDDLDDVRDLLDESADPRIFDDVRILRLVTPLIDDTQSKNANVDALVGWDSAGRLQAIGIVSLHPNPLTEVQADILGVTRPQWRGRGIGRALLEWQDGRARQMMLGAGHDLPASIRSRVRSDNMGRRRLLAAGGFSPQWRWTFMDLDLTDEHREMAKDARVRLAERGMSLRHLDESDSEEVRRLHNRVSMVMERRQPLSAQQWQERLEDSDHEASTILTDGANLVGYSLCSASGTGECLRVIYYGIDRGFRHDGNGTDLILSQIDHALDRGFKRMCVPIVSENTPATEFLTTHGFFEGDSHILYSIDI